MDPDAACASCHRAIYERYRKTPMANASGAATEGFLPADYVHAASGVHYRIDQEDGHVWLSYERDDAARPLSGRQELWYFLGSGRRGRTYLFERQGYWFEAPINWYAKKRVWDMTPHYQDAREMPLTLPVDPGCLHCHASGAASSLPDARNHYASEPFAAGGVTCAACHGDGSAHVASGGRVRMLDIDALEPVRRDSVCLNCHLEGQAAVDRPGKRIEDFVPGENLFDFTLFFVFRNEDGSGGRATSQWEALLKSACKQKSGDRMTCTSCHDPHGSPAPEERVAFYRAKCLACHTGAAFAERHHPENPDCTACHMARPPANDIAHEQVTDHWIRRRVSQERLPLATSGTLVTVGGVPADDRDLGLAYVQMAARGDRDAGEKAMLLLREAERTEAGAASDHTLHAQLGFLEQMNGETGRAAEEYRAALRDDPYDELAAGDLALIELRGGDTADALRLWLRVVDDNPTARAATMNLAQVACREGRRDEAAETLERLLSFSPDDQEARRLKMAIENGQCGAQ
ncbi:MAG TPA: tetratricopeptide repeat protein [Terracidiphilus sp.]|nr:tetratricopeptide repeat protein [Terracidiphilus sp.]